MEMTKDSPAVARGRRISELRQSAKMSKREFAKTVGISPAYVVYLESGHRGDGSEVEPSDAMLQMIAYKFGCSYYWLKTGEGDKRDDLRQRLVAKIANLPDKLLPKLRDLMDTLE